MEVPKEIRTYCPHCKTHTVHKVKKVIQKKSPAPARKTAWGQVKFERRAKGYTSRLAGNADHVKQSQKNVLVLECTQCHKKQQRTVGGRTRKKIELKKGA